MGTRWPFLGTARPLKSGSAGSRTRSLGQREARKSGGKSRELGERLDPTETLAFLLALRFSVSEDASPAFGPGSLRRPSLPPSPVFAARATA